MIKLLWITSLLLCLSSSWATSTHIRKEILSLLPQELSGLSPEDTEAKLRKKFKKQIIYEKSDSNILYLNYFDQQNDVSIGLKNRHFHYLWIKATPEMIKKSSDLFTKVFSRIDHQQRNKLAQEQYIPNHDAGRSITIYLPQESIQLKFSNNENKNLQTIVIWLPGEAGP